MQIIFRAESFSEGDVDEAAWFSVPCEIQSGLDIAPGSRMRETSENEVIVLRFGAVVQ